MEEKVKELKLINNVIFAGAHIHIEDYYSAADCFVLSSAWEGFGLVLAEAMAANLPVLTTDAGAVLKWWMIMNMWCQHMILFTG